jgi:uncharacterized membrane protein YoaK (UPF0700 family)
LNKQRIQMSESFMVGALLAITGGFLDAYTYLLRGRVFANAQTGNMVLFAIKLSEGEYKAAAVYLIPIFAFVIGIIIAEFVREKIASNQRFHWRQVIILFELFILLFTAFLPVGSLDGVVNVLISFVCAMQVEAFRKIKGNAYATTMCTGNLRSASEYLFHFAVAKDRSALIKSIVYFGIILFFIMGALIGTFLSNHYGRFSVLFCCILLLIVSLLMFRQEESDNVT